MKPNFIHKILLLIIFSYLGGVVLAQKPKLCGPYKINFPALQKAQQFEAANFQNLQAANSAVRVYFHICRNDDGTNSAATEAQIQTELNSLAADYTSDNLCFINCGINYINNTKINTNINPDVPSDVALLNSFVISNCINIFYHASLIGYGGNAYSIPNTFFSVDEGNIGAGHTISHEMGHCLGMLHTFNTGTGYEDIDGSNSATTADMITDTRADPYAYLGQSCFSTAGCVYNGICTDPKGATNFTPPYANMMAYWWTKGCYPNLAFTPNQLVRINSFLNTNSDLEDCESPLNYTIPPLSISGGYYFPSAINTLTTSGSVIISGFANATLGGQTVFAEPGFRATPSGDGLVLLRLSSCNGSSLKFINNTKQNTIAENNGAQDKNELIAYPNPAKSIVNITFNLDNAESNAMIQLYNMDMRKVKEISLGNLITGKHNVQLNLNNLSSGVYLVILKLQYNHMTTKIVLIK